jgi:hypothetical protein
MPGVSCETQDQPNLEAGLGAPPMQTSAPAQSPEEAMAPAFEEVDLGAAEELAARAEDLLADGRENAAERVQLRLYQEVFQDNLGGGKNAKGGDGK